MANSVNEEVLGESFYSLYEYWYINVIRELACILDFKDDFKLLANFVFPKISPAKAKKSVDKLIKIGILIKSSKGTYNQTKKAITTKMEISSLAIRNFNSQMIQLAQSSLESVPQSERHISGITMGISQPCFQILCTEIQAFRERVIQIVHADDVSDQVYQINIQLFPTSKKREKI